MPQEPRKPKSQFEISTNKELKHDRSQDIRRDDNVKDFTVKLKDIDTALLSHLENTVIPVLEDNGTSYKIPVIYGSPERWNSVRKDGYYKDKDGKIQLPLIMFRRTGITKNRNLSNKVDANHPQVYQTFSKQWSRKNAYNQFNLLNNISPVLEQYNIVVPDYVDITYECIVWTDFMEQMNTIVEAINYAEGSYWGDPENYKFRVRIDDFSNIVDLPSDNDRMVRTSFNINLAGYIIPDGLNASLSKTRKAHTNFTLRFGQEVEGRMEISDTPSSVIKSSGVVNSNPPRSTINPLSSAVLNYLALNITKNSDAVSGAGDVAYFNDSFIASAPAPLPATSKDNFTVFINGQLITTSLVISIIQVGNTVEITFDTANLGYTLSTSDHVVAIGKFSPSSDTSL